jgi:hypothetical protein
MDWTKQKKCSLPSIIKKFKIKKKLFFLKNLNLIIYKKNNLKLFV